MEVAATQAGAAGRGTRDPTLGLGGGSDGRSRPSGGV
jgi:hypothetical protein